MAQILSDKPFKIDCGVNRGPLRRCLFTQRVDNFFAFQVLYTRMVDQLSLHRCQNQLIDAICTSISHDMKKFKLFSVNHDRFCLYILIGKQHCNFLLRWSNRGHFSSSFTTAPSGHQLEKQLWVVFWELLLRTQKCLLFDDTHQYNINWFPAWCFDKLF